MSGQTSNERYQRVEALFQQVLDLPEERRDRFIEQNCDGDDATRDELRDLLDHYSSAGDAFLATPPFEPPLLRTPTRVGRYEILGLLGEGGMGSVFEARQQQPARSVALKLMRQWLRSPRSLRRFELEAEILGRLDHPGIAHVYEAGVADAAYSDGGVASEPFLAMELVRGETLLRFAEREKLPLGARVDLLVSICEALHYAHQKGVIHRDLKPANIVATDSGQPKILDFGVARPIDPERNETLAAHTAAGQLIGTLVYTSPEQLLSDPRAIDTRSDVYSLGVVAYELLCGRPPIDVAGLPVAQAIRLLTEADPPRAGAVRGELRGDLEAVLAKALEKSPEQRYGSAADFAADLTRYLRHEPVLARPYSAWNRAAKFARRNTGLVVGVAMTFVALALGLFATSLFAIRAEARRKDAANALVRAEDAEREAKKHAEDLEKVAAFQARQLGNTDIEQMGAQIRAAILEQYEAPNPSSGDADREGSTGVLDRLLADVNFSNIAKESLDERVFAPAMTALEEDFAGQPVVQAALYQSIADTLEALGLYDRASTAQENAVDIRRRVLGEDDPDTLLSIHNLAFLRRRQGRLDEAESLHREALDGLLRVLGEDDERTLMALDNMGVIFELRGNLKEAERCYRRAAEAFERLKGPEDRDTLVAIGNVGFILQIQGKTEEAEPYYSHVLETRRRVLGPEDSTTLIAMNNMAYLLVQRGRLNEAEKLHREVLEIRRRVQGDQHPEVFNSQHNLADTLFRAARTAEAESLCRAALEGRQRLLGDEHFMTIASTYLMAQIRIEQDRPREAVDLLEPRLSAARTAFAGNPPRLGAFLATLGEACAGVHDYVAAEAALAEAHDILAASAGPENARTRRCVEALITLYETWDAAEPDSGRRDRAAQLRAELSDANPAPSD